MQDEYRKWLDAEYRPIGGGSPEADPNDGSDGSSDDSGSNVDAGAGEEGEGNAEGGDKGKPDVRQAYDRVVGENKELKRMLESTNQTVQSLQTHVQQLTQRANEGDVSAQDDLDDLDTLLGEGATGKLAKFFDKRIKKTESQLRGMIDSSLAPFGTQAVNSELAELRKSPMWNSVAEKMESRLSELKAVNYALKPGDARTLFTGFVGEALMSGKIKAPSSGNGDGTELEGTLSASHNSPGLPRKASGVKMTPELQKFMKEHRFEDAEAAAAVLEKKQELSKVSKPGARERQATIKR